jgi:hypothetical protein
MAARRLRPVVAGKGDAVTMLGTRDFFRQISRIASARTSRPAGFLPIAAESPAEPRCVASGSYGFSEKR